MIDNRIVYDYYFGAIHWDSPHVGLTDRDLRPLATFIKMYVFRLGFLDGTHGLILAVLYGYYTFLKYAKTREGKRGSSEA